MSHKLGWSQQKRQNVVAGSGVLDATSVCNKRHGLVSIGTGVESTIKTVKTRSVSVFATKFSPDPESETLALYLKCKLNREVTCQKIDNVRSRVGSFKGTAECNYIGEMYTPELWPEVALVWRYYEPRKASTEYWINTG